MSRGGVGGAAAGEPQLGQYWKNAFLRAEQAVQWSNSVMPQWTQKFEGASGVPAAIGRSHPGHTPDAMRFSASS